MADVLFEVTKEHLETGLRGVPVGYCITSTVDPEKGLFYKGRPLTELAHHSVESVIYLLFYGKEPTDQELNLFKKELQRRSSISPKVLEAIQRLPREIHPMKLFSIALMLCGEFETVHDYREDALNVIAKLPLLTATVINFHAGWGGIQPPKPELGYIENFTQMLQVPGANLKELSEVMRLFNVLHYDHGGGNLSVFTGKAVASGLEGMYGSLAAAMNALAGPRHGKANQDCLEFVKGVLDVLGKNATADQVEKLVRDRLAANELVFGFGHAVLRVEDPRATLFYEIAKKEYKDHPLSKIALMLRERGTLVLKENPKISNPYPNVDAISGTILTAAGFPYPEYYTVLFGLSRVVGISRQIVYERLEAREGKGTPIMRPKYIFRGDL